MHGAAVQVQRTFRGHRSRMDAKKKQQAQRSAVDDPAVQSADDAAMDGVAESTRQRVGHQANGDAGVSQIAFSIF